jgi:hypothetical protein
MKKLFLLLILSFFSAQSFSGECPDGSEPVKSVSDDGTYFVYKCGGQASSSSVVNSKTKAVAGIDIENDPDINFFARPVYPQPTRELYWWISASRKADFNNDGLTDIIYIGVMHTSNQASSGTDTGDICGVGVCKGDKPQPALYLGGADGKLHYSPELLIDNREDSGMSLGRQLLIADYNNDNVLDIYIADHGLGTHDGYRDSYYLSQPNGTWLESSDTHLSHDNFKVFDHGGATGDIDNDGDMDVVITETNWKTGTALWCLINDGTGYLKKRKCGGIYSFALELADIDGDGYLDVLLGAHEFEKSIDFTGIVWNDGRGNFPKHNATSLPQHKKKWGTIPEVSASDLDNDGDLDIVYSRAGELYVGAAIQIIENLGNKKFRDHGIIPLLEAPPDFKTETEGNEWNGSVDIQFNDLDSDGDYDLYLESNVYRTDGAVIINNGDFNFSLIMPPEAYKLYRAVGQDGVIMPKGYLKERIAEPKKSQEEDLSPYQQSQIKLLNDQRQVQVCDAVFKEFFGDYYNRTNKDTYFFVSLDSNKKNCHYEWSGNERTAFKQCEQNTKASGKCTIYAIGDTAVWGNPNLYKELTGSK